MTIVRPCPNKQANEEIFSESPYDSNLASASLVVKEKMDWQVAKDGAKAWYEATGMEMSRRIGKVG